MKLRNVVHLSFDTTYYRYPVFHQSTHTQEQTAHGLNNEKQWWVPYLFYLISLTKKYYWIYMQKKKPLHPCYLVVKCNLNKSFVGSNQEPLGVLIEAINLVTFTVATASTAPAAPSRWPIIDLVEFTFNCKTNEKVNEPQLRWHRYRMLCYKGYEFTLPQGFGQNNERGLGTPLGLQPASMYHVRLCSSPLLWIPQTGIRPSPYIV